MKPLLNHGAAVAALLLVGACSTYKPLDAGSSVPWAQAVAVPVAKPAVPRSVVEVSEDRSRVGTQSVQVTDIPTADLSGQVHRVERGEVLAVIARRHGVAVTDLAGVNRLAPPYRIYPGQVLRVPGSTSVRPAAAPSEHHVVQRGENLSLIARRYGLSPSALVRANSLRSPDAIYVGQKLTLPEGTPTVIAARGEAPRQAVSDDGFIWPVQGKVVAGFGRKEDGEISHGITIAARKGTPVRAARGGEVIYAGDAIRGYGRMILIRHVDDYVTTYAHNSALLVNVGDRIERGQIIARVGDTGGVSQPQLHFELRQGRKPLDPEGFLVGLPTTVASSG